MTENKMEMLNSTLNLKKISHVVRYIAVITLRL